MKKSQYIKQRRIRQRNLERVMYKNMIWHIIIITIIMIIALYNMPRVVITEKEDTSKKVSESYSNKTTTPYTHNLVTFEPQTEEESSEVEVDYYSKFTYSKDWDSEDSYLLAKIAMAEAEGCNIQTKTLVIMTVLNRVWSDEFPDTIKDVIFQEYNGVYQFTPIADGRWNRVEPNEDCYKAVKIVMEAVYDDSGGALYFESCADEDNWHSRNLEFLYESDGLRFYK